MTAEHRPDQFVLTLSRERGRRLPPSSAFSIAIAAMSMR